MKEFLTLSNAWYDPKIIEPVNFSDYGVDLVLTGFFRITNHPLHKIGECDKFKVIDDDKFSLFLLKWSEFIIPIDSHLDVNGRLIF